VGVPVVQVECGADPVARIERLDVVRRVRCAVVELGRSPDLLTRLWARSTA
jgi:hypothetical protein